MRGGDGGGFCDVGGLAVDPRADFRKCSRGFLECGAVPAANRYGGSQNGKLARDRAADAAATARDERNSASQRGLFPGLSLCFSYSRHENYSFVRATLFVRHSSYHYSF